MKFQIATQLDSTININLMKQQIYKGLKEDRTFGLQKLKVMCDFHMELWGNNLFPKHIKM